MAPLPSESIPLGIPLIIPAIVISILTLTTLLMKCLRSSATTPVALINSHNASLDKIEDGQGKMEFPNDTGKPGTIIIDETTQNEIETRINPTADIKNASMMNLLLSHTPQSSFQNDSGPAQSVSNENILMPPVLKSHSPSLSATPKNQSSKSLDSATVLENLNSAHEMSALVRKKCGSVSRDNSPSPDYDEVKLAPTQTPQSPSKSPLKSSSSANNQVLKNRHAELFFNPPELPARNLRLSSLTLNPSEEVYESIHDEFVQELDTPTSPLSRDGGDEDESAYASVDARGIKSTLDPPSLPAPRLPEATKTVKDGTLEKKKRSRKNRNSYQEKSDTHPLPIEPLEPTEATRKKTKSFTPFNKIRPSKKNQNDAAHTSTSPGPFETSGEAALKGFRGALPPLPKGQVSDPSDTEEGYSCITVSSKPVLSKSSASSEEDPYSELTYDPTKKSLPPKKVVDSVAVDYLQVTDGNTSPMEIDQSYSSIEEVKGGTLPKHTNPGETPLSDTELSPRALPQPPIELNLIIPHQYVKPEEVKRRKAEQRIRKEEERRLSGYVVPTQEATTDVPPEDEPVTKPIPTSQFPSLKSIFSDFRKDEDIVTQNMSVVLGLPPPEPPNDSDDETQSYASAAEVRERKARKPVPPPDPAAEAPKMNPIREYQPDSMEVNAASFLEDIGDHTYSSVTDALSDACPYEEPNSLMGPFTPTYEDPEDLGIRFQGKNESEPKSKIDYPLDVDLAAVSSGDGEHRVSQKVSQDLSKLREQKGYVKVSHQKENIPEYASIDDMQKEKIRVDSEDDPNATQSTTISEDSTLSSQTLKDDSTATVHEVSI